MIQNYFKNTILFCLCTLALSCKTVSKADRAKIKGVKLTEIFPIKWNEDWTVSKYDTTDVSIFFFKNKVVCKFSYIHESYTNFVLDSVELWHYYIAFSKGNTKGFQFKEWAEKKEEQVLLDSVFKYQPIFRQNFNVYFSDSINARLLNAVKDTTTGELTEEYYISSKLKENDTSRNCLLNLHYSDKVKFKEYSLSRELDSVKQMKLIDVKITSFPKYYSSINKTQGAFSIMYHMEEIEPENKKKLMYYFNKVDVKNGN